mmetsp:Transcript_17716/g.28687  ORF Transcript_17716/g.28687 Transcript_17716/m.28687 type:complete len:239 (-) Transcript_17716:201-917(-)
MLLDEPLHIESTIRRLLQHPLLGNNSRNIFSRGYIKCRIPTWHVLGSDTTLYHFLCWSFLYLNLIATLQINIQCREGTRHEEFHSHLLRNDGQIERSYFVRSIPIGTNTISAHHAGIGPLALQITRRHRIAQQRAVHTLRPNFVRCQPRSLVVRPRLQRGDATKFVPTLQFSRHAKRCSPAGRGEGASVADGDKSHSVGVGVAEEQIVGAMGSDGLVVGYVSFEHELGVSDDDINDLL